MVLVGSFHTTDRPTSLALAWTRGSVTRIAAVTQFTATCFAAEYILAVHTGWHT